MAYVRLENSVQLIERQKSARETSPGRFALPGFRGMRYVPNDRRAQGAVEKETGNEKD